LIKDDESPKLADAIRTIHEGGIALTPELAFVIHLRPPLLSPKDHQALLLRSRGHSYESIASRIGIASRR
jgi:DNA-binding NarL/FixJ family response regulator